MCVGNDMQSVTTLISVNLVAAAASVATRFCLYGGWACISQTRVTLRLQLGAIWSKTGQSLPPSVQAQLVGLPIRGGALRAKASERWHHSQGHV